MLTKFGDRNLKKTFSNLKDLPLIGPEGNNKLAWSFMDKPNCKNIKIATTQKSGSA